MRRTLASTLAELAGPAIALVLGVAIAGAGLAIGASMGGRANAGSHSQLMAVYPSPPAPFPEYGLWSLGRPDASR